ncbi:hypothetical protein AAFC00_001666 [Neodothiora populina]|uniref:CinA C-terminal domain-containing protein n=1 Tax=Neodothiora populina TaxID=2781224 RepID=A0ABR3PPZ6_9PEZI
MASSGFPPQSLKPLLAEVTTLLSSRNELVAVAETAAGGILSSSLLSTPGASKIYAGGLTLYTLEARVAFGGWTQENIANYAGPTSDIVKGLARHVRGQLSKATYAIAESGTAGPSAGGPRGQDGEDVKRRKTPGYVVLAVDCADGRCFSREVETGLGGDRAANMVRFAEEGLRLLRDVIKGDIEGDELFP